MELRAVQGIFLNIFSEILNLEGHQNHCIGSKVKAILLKGWIYAYWWSCIGKGLHLHPGQQAYCI